MTTDQRERIAQIIFGEACGEEWDNEFWREERDGCFRCADMILAALSAPTQAQAVAEWQDISTAPKDRNIIITGRYANGRAYVEEGCWNYHGHFRKFDQPTHWMPMPQPHGGWDAPLIAEERSDGKMLMPGIDEYMDDNGQ